MDMNHTNEQDLVRSEERSLLTVPLSTEQIQEVFLNEKFHCLIDWGNSELQNESLLTYIANIQISCEFTNTDSVSSVDKLAVLEAFLKHKLTIKCHTLSEALAFVMLRYRASDFTLPAEFWLSNDEIDTFIENNKDSLEEASRFFDAMVLTAASFFNKINEEYIKPGIEVGHIEVVEACESFTPNMIGLITVPSFLEVFLTLDVEDNQKSVCLSPDSLQTLIYDEKDLFTLFMSLGENSFLMGAIYLLYSETPEAIECMQEFIEKN